MTIRVVDYEPNSKNPKMRFTKYFFSRKGEPSLVTLALVFNVTEKALSNIVGKFCGVLKDPLWSTFTTFVFFDDKFHAVDDTKGDVLVNGLVDDKPTGLYKLKL
jgi:hypothetical protein